MRPASGIQHAANIRHPACGQHPASSMRPTSGIQHAANIRHPACGQHAASIRQVSGIQYATPTSRVERADHDAAVLYLQQRVV
jgi:hypothetical protein